MPGFRVQSGRDGGAAMIIVLTVVAIIAALGSTAALLAANNLGSARSDRQGGVAENMSEAGVAQAIAYIRNAGVGRLVCSPSCNPASGQPDWGQGPNISGAGPNASIAADASYGHLVTRASGQQYRVWIERVAPLAPPTTKIGLYAIHSLGKFNGSASGTGTRILSVDVNVSPYTYPIGVFAHTVQAGGNGGIHYESLFSDSCIQGRQFETFQGTDAYYGVPAAAHSSDVIVSKQNDACTSSTSIHTASSGASLPCNTAYPDDTDHYGNALTAGGACYGHGYLNGSTWLTTGSSQCRV